MKSVDAFRGRSGTIVKLWWDQYDFHLRVGPSWFSLQGDPVTFSFSPFFMALSDHIIIIAITNVLLLSIIYWCWCFNMHCTSCFLLQLGITDLQLNSFFFMYLFIYFRDLYLILRVSLFDCNTYESRLNQEKKNKMNN